MPFQATSQVAEPLWTSREELERLYGKTAIGRWADVENTRSEAEITNKIQWAIELATVDAKSLLSGSPAGTVVNPPLNVRNATTKLAGVHLYSARGVFDNTDDKEGRNRLTQHKRDAETFFRRVHAGQIQLLADVTSAPTCVPVVVQTSMEHFGERLTPQEIMEQNDADEKSGAGSQWPRDTTGSVF